MILRSERFRKRGAFVGDEERKQLVAQCADGTFDRAEFTWLLWRKPPSPIRSRTPRPCGHYGRSFIPDTPEAQRRLQEALGAIGRGTETSGVVLELRRRDNGKPLWIQWWSRPDPSGTFTRTMFLDITERVLMEREKARLEADNVYLREEIKAEHNFEEIIGASPAIKEVFKAIEQVAPTDSTVLSRHPLPTGWYSRRN